MATETDWSEYESGPFCRHWSEASDCDKKCAACGCPCIRHGVGNDKRCDECDCKEWTEREDNE